MKRHAAVVVALVSAILLTWAPAALADKVIGGVPDWNQPQAHGVAGYPSWCSPTAGACLMGYWEDVLMKVGLTDRAAFPGSPLFPNTAGTWQQGLWHDGTIEMGWYMDTGSWKTNGGPFPPNAGCTLLVNIGPGAVAYAQTNWVDAATGIIKQAYAATTWKDVVLNPQTWANYCAEIDAGRPVLVSYDGWVTNMTGTITVDGKMVELWNVAGTGDGHTVCGVGYIDPDPNHFVGDERIIAQDNWANTGQYVGVVLNGWVQNDYFNVPEPATVALVTLGGLVLLRRRR